MNTLPVPPRHPLSPTRHALVDKQPSTRAWPPARGSAWALTGLGLTKGPTGFAAVQVL